MIFLSLTSNGKSLVGLVKGSKVPAVTLRSTEGTQLNLSKLNKKTVLVFYRGSWCPYCMNQLKDLDKSLVPKLQKDTQVVAISVDRMKVAKKMKEKYSLTFTVLSDPKATSLKAFEIANKISDELNEKYKTAYKIDIEADSGEKHHLVAHPGVFIVKNGMIVFRDVHTDYTQRTEVSKILDVLNKI